MLLQLLVIFSNFTVNIGRQQSSKQTASHYDNLAFTSEDQVLEDKLFIKFTIRDLSEKGIEIIFLDSNDRTKSKMVFAHQRGFNTEGEMLLAGSGNSVYIKDIRIDKRERIQMHDIDVRSYDCC